MRATSIKLPDQLDRRLTELAKRRHTSRSRVMREALEAFDRQTTKATVASLAGDLIGSLEGPGDLLSNPKHMAGYGR